MTHFQIFWAFVAFICLFWSSCTCSSSNNSEILDVATKGGIDWENLDPSERQSLNQTCKCGTGIPRRNSTKIVGGVSSLNHGWPWMGSIVYTSSSPPSPICGGSLINNWYLLTAAHCAAAIKSNGGPSKFKIYLGSNRINSNTNKTDVQAYSIGAIKIHPKYEASTMNYDIAVLRFNTPVNFTSTINPICLSQSGDPYVGRQAIVAGWGVSVFGTKNTSNVLRETYLKVWPTAECNKTYSGVITSQMICAYAPKKDSCQGDSGGPLIVKKGNGTTSGTYVYTQVGVTSFGKGCGDLGIAGVYARVSKVIGWIKGQTKKATYCSDSFGTGGTSRNRTSMNYGVRNETSI